jgi:predicted nucleotidyltransferase component of viral defense system
VRLPVHAAYDLPPAIPVMPLVENMAEKIARLTRRTPARDVYDLAWISSTSPHSGFDRVLVRRLAVLKNWVDQHGLSSPPAIWRPVTGAVPYNADRWHATRHAADFDEDSIGILAVPPPSLDALGDQLRTHFGFLADLDATEQRIITGGAGSRNLVLEAIASLPGSRFTNRPLY